MGYGNAGKHERGCMSTNTRFRHHPPPSRPPGAPTEIIAHGASENGIHGGHVDARTTNSESHYHVDLGAAARAIGLSAIVLLGMLLAFGERLIPLVEAVYGS